MTDDVSAVASTAALDHLRWSLVPEVGPVLMARLVEHFGSAGEALRAGVRSLAAVPGIGPTRAAAIVRGREEADVPGELALAQEHGVRILCPDDEEYPRLLRHIPDRPIVLYVRGSLEPEDTLAVAIVGSRRCTQYGREQSDRFGYQLASHGFTVVSGLARGIDGAAHHAAIRAGGRTIAVLGNGLSCIYPPEHAELAEHIVRHGALVSELPMTTAPTSRNFLPRNRLIAGLSLGVLVVEAARRSGALTTAKMALEYDREVFAVPGRIDVDSSQGTNALIRDQHAKLVMGIEDVHAELGEAGKALAPPAFEAVTGARTPVTPAAPAGLTADEQTVYAVLDGQERSLETIAAAAGCATGRVATALIGLQLRGLVRQMPGNMFIRLGAQA